MQQKLDDEINLSLYKNKDLNNTPIIVCVIFCLVTSFYIIKEYPSKYFVLFIINLCGIFFSWIFFHGSKKIKNGKIKISLHSLDCFSISSPYSGNKKIIFNPVMIVLTSYDQVTSQGSYKVYAIKCKNKIIFHSKDSKLTNAVYENIQKIISDINAAKFV